MRNSSNCPDEIAKHPFDMLLNFTDEMMVGRHLSSACYMDKSMPATLYLPLKYVETPVKGLISNTICTVTMLDDVLF